MKIIAEYVVLILVQQSALDFMEEAAVVESHHKVVMVCTSRHIAKLGQTSIECKFAK